jgi:hypothetical protein
MNKGIRDGITHKFNAMLEHRAAMGDSVFRKAVIDWGMEQFGIGRGAASTHYNTAKHIAMVERPEAVVGLGRSPEKNNGGRKKKVAIVAETFADDKTDGSDVAY